MERKQYLDKIDVLLLVVQKSNDEGSLMLNIDENRKSSIIGNVLYPSKH